MPELPDCAGRQAMLQALLFSGRPNPSVEMSDEACRALFDAVGAVAPSTTPMADPPLGYGGMQVVFQTDAGDRFLDVHGGKLRFGGQDYLDPGRRIEGQLLRHFLESAPADIQPIVAGILEAL